MLKKTLENPLDCKEIQPINPKGNQSWILIEMTDAEAEAPVLWPPDTKSWVIWRPWCWAILKSGGEGDNRGQNGWRKSLTQWTWVWAGSGRWWRTWKSGMLQSMELQRVGHDWATEQEQQTRACKSGEVLAWPFPDQFTHLTGLALIKFSDLDLCYWSSQMTNIQKQNTNVLFYSK